MDLIYPEDLTPLWDVEFTEEQHMAMANAEIRYLRRLAVRKGWGARLGIPTRVAALAARDGNVLAKHVISKRARLMDLEDLSILWPDELTPIQWVSVAIQEKIRRDCYFYTPGCYLSSPKDDWVCSRHRDHIGPCVALTSFDSKYQWLQVWY